MSQKPQRKLDPRFTLVWKLIALAALVTETVAIFMRGQGDTLSEHIWWIRDNPRMVGLFSLMIAIFIWSIYHFTREG